MRVFVEYCGECTAVGLGELGFIRFNVIVNQEVTLRDSLVWFDVKDRRPLHVDQQNPLDLESGSRHTFTKRP